MVVSCINMVWVPNRPQTDWERQCVKQAANMFTINWVDVGRYKIPTHQTRMPQGASDWVRWHIMMEPNQLYSDCDIWWNHAPDFGDMFVCAKLSRGGYAPDDAVLWSGAHPEIGQTVVSLLQQRTVWKPTLKLLRNILRKQHHAMGTVWRYELKGGIYDSPDPRMA